MKKLFLFTLLICLGAFASFAQKGNKERIKVHSKALEGNLIGDSADRDVTVYLDLPVQNGEPRQDVINKIIANRTLNFVDQYILNLKKNSRPSAWMQDYRTGASAMPPKPCTRSWTPIRSTTSTKVMRAITSTESPSEFRRKCFPFSPKTWPLRSNTN